jgi:hypothetical protein
LAGAEHLLSRGTSSPSSYDNLARAALIAAIPTLYALGSLQLWHVFVLALLAGALSPATAAGVRAFLPHLVDDAALDRANALTTTSLQFSYLVGPVAAGFAVARLGGPWARFSLRYVPALTLHSLVFFFYGPLEAALPVYSGQTLHGNAGGYRLLWTGFGAGPSLVC